MIFITCVEIFIKLKPARFQLSSLNHRPSKVQDLEIEQPRHTRPSHKLKRMCLLFKFVD
jgi:hypothetical protein